MRLLIIIMFFLIATACGERVDIPISQMYNTNVRYVEKIPGKWSSIIQSDTFYFVVEPRDFGDSYVVDANTVFRKSVEDLLAGLFEQIVFSDNAFPENSAMEGPFVGVISVRSDDFTAGIRGCEASVELSAIVTVDLPKGRLFGFTASGDWISQCGGRADMLSAPEAFSEATTNAVRELTNEIAMIIAGSSRLHRVNRKDTQKNPSKHR